ncbi:MAG TPA: outer membrane porin, OprD family [Campylobacterales bacterium]|nr:outer membrane porin, OprD family [Campylobacterales bacterium]HHS93423.1 outer membrane porin, OprD family [Campylobacterales bacterium]
MSLVVLSGMFAEGANLVDALTNGKVEGYVRSTYHVHNLKNDKTYKDDGIGGKVHFKTADDYKMRLGATLYATTQLFYNDNSPIVPLRGEDNRAYAILGELYLEGKFDKTVLKLGRQELNTPFADMDDIGMVPNTFEALTMVNQNINDTEVFVGQINKMAGVDAEVTDKFTKINGSHNMQLMGVAYGGIENLELSGWYNRLHKGEVDSIGYLESTYTQALTTFEYVLGVQYAKETYSMAEDTQVWGAKLDIGIKPYGLVLMAGYNQVGNNAAFSGFGGGPFYVASEFLILDHAGKNGEARCLGLEYEASAVGLDGLVLGLSRLDLETEAKESASELDFLASYTFTDDLEGHMIYADVKGVNVGESDAKHFRAYLNYHF